MSIKKADWDFVEASNALPYRILQLEKDIEEKCVELREMRHELKLLKKQEMGK